MLALGRGLQYVVDRGFGSGDPRLLDQALAAMIVVVALFALATWVRFYFMMTIGERVVTDLRRAVFDHIIGLDPAFFEKERTGEVVSRLTNDTTLVQQVIGYGLSMFVRNSLMMVGAAVMLFVTSWKLALLVLVGAPATLLPILLLGRRVRRLSRASQDRVADVSAYVDEAIHEIRTVQAYAHEDADRASFARHAEARYAVGVTRIRHKAFLIAAVILIAFSAVGIILWIGGHDVLAGRLTAGRARRLRVLRRGGRDRRRHRGRSVGRAAARRGRDRAPGRAARDAGAHRRAAGAGGRADRARAAELISRTCGSNIPRAPEFAALERFTLRIAPGERVALVGPSGAGKSTVFALLLRFYDPQPGRGAHRRRRSARMEPRAARRLVAVVPQEPVIFAASVLDNVRYGRPDASRDAVAAACEKACALEFIERLPQGFDTPLGERGVTLSGGQKQRLSIARALLADRPILLLDEATSSLDAAAERLVQQGLDALEKGRTTLVIAHRLATVQTRRPHRGARARRDRRAGHARRAHAPGRPLCQPGAPAVSGRER